VVSAKLDRELNPGTDHLLRLLGEATGANRAYIFLLRDNGSKMDNTHEWCSLGTDLQINNLQDLDPASFPWWMEKLGRGETIAVSDVGALPPEAAAEQAFLQAQNVRSLLIVPLQSSDGKLLGFMGVGDTEKARNWPSERVLTLRAVSEMIAGHLTRQRVEDVLRLLTENVSMVSLLDHAVNRGDDLHETLKLLSNEIKRVFLCDNAALYLVDEGKKELLFQDPGTLSSKLKSTVEKLTGIPIRAGARIPLTEGSLCHEILQAGRPQLLNDSRTIQALVAELAGSKELEGLVPALFSALAIKSVISFPLIAGNEAVGFVIGSRDEPAFAESDLERLRFTSEHLTTVFERKQFEEALRESEERFHSVVETAADAIIIADSQGNIVLWSPVAQKMFGYSTDEAVGKPLTLIMPERFHEKHQKGVQRFVSSGRTKVTDTTIELAGLRKDGSEFPVELSLASWEVAGEPYFGGIILDATERKRAEAALVRERDLLRSRREELEALRRVTLDITTQLDQETLLQDLVESAQKLLGASAGSLYLCQPDRDVLEWAVSTGEGSVPVGTALRRGQRPSGKVRERGKPLMVDDCSLWEGKVTQFATVDANAVLAASIRWRNEFLGVINVAHHGDPSRTFSERDAHLLSLFADQAAIAIKNAQLYASEREQRALAEALMNAAAALSGTLDIDEVLNRILPNVEQVIPHSGANVMLIDEEEGAARIVGACQCYAKHGLSAPRSDQSIPLADVLTLRRMAETRQPLMVSDIDNYTGWVGMPGLEWIQSYAGAPIVVEDKVIGFLNFDSDTPGAFTAVHAEHLQVFAGQAAIAIQNARLYEELEIYSSILEQAVDEATVELRRAKERVETILNHSPDAILLLAPDGTIETTNPAFLKMFSYVGDELRGQELANLVESDHIAPLHHALEVITQQHSPQQVELVTKRKDGSTFDVQAVLGAIQENGDLLGIVCSLRDITALKDIERMRNEFLSTATHELRTPLTSIQGFSEILLTRELQSQRQKHYLTMINDQATQLARIIDELLDLSRLESKQGLQFDFKPVRMDGLVAEMLQPFVDTSPRHHFQLKGLHNASPVLADRFRLMQVLRNLVSNAIKYSPDGGKITILAQPTSGYLTVSVQDEGIGMTPEQQVRLFEKFYRVDSTSTPGTGLGLVICKVIVEGHGGEIWVESKPGVGSAFCFTLPLVEV
jgi:PAS domain S-box-containing protein